MVRNIFLFSAATFYLVMHSGNSMSCIRLTDDDCETPQKSVVTLEGIAKNIVLSALASFDVTQDIEQFNQKTGLQVLKDPGGLVYNLDAGTCIYYQPSQAAMLKALFVEQLDNAALSKVMQAQNK